MNAAQRRKVILERLTEANAPLSASVLAGELGVSRQIVVGDVALLRASGTQIDATPRGYQLHPAARGYTGILACVHSTADQMREELYTVVDQVHIHAEGPAFFCWLPKMLGKRVVVTIHGIDWQREKWQSGLGSKFIHQGEKNAAKYADEVIVLSKGVQDYFKEE